MDCMTTTYDVCIRGCGSVGSALALMLARLRLRVALVGTPPPANDVRAFALNASSQATLNELRCWPGPAHATPVLSMHVWGDQGGDLRFDAPQGTCLNHIVDVPALEKLLQEAVGFQQYIERIEQPVDAALTVICEGKNSFTRQELGIDFDAFPYAQHAIATRVRCEQPHQQQAFQWFSQSSHALSILALLPLGGPQGDEVAVVWSLPNEQAHRLYDISDEAFANELSQACQHRLGSFQLCAPKSKWPLQTAQAKQWSGRFANGHSWVLAGDAAHTVHPLAGMGLNLGLADAQALASTLAQREGKDYWRSVGDPSLLRQYERARKAGLWPTWIACDGLQRLFSHSQPLAQSFRNWGMSSFNQLTFLKQWTVHQAMNPSF